MFLQNPCPDTLDVGLDGLSQRLFLQPAMSRQELHRPIADYDSLTFETAAARYQNS